MASDGPGKVIGELVTLLGALNIRVRFATDESEPRNIDRRGAASRSAGEVIEQPAARKLEAQFVHFVVADRPGILRHESEVPVGLIRSAGERVLPEDLILSIDLNSGNRAGAHVGPKTQAIVAAHVVVDA